MSIYYTKHANLRMLVLLILMFIFLSPASVRSNDDHKYGKIDTYALQATAADEGDISKLAAYLSKGAATEEEKARAIYAWIAGRIAYNYGLGETYDASNAQPAHILKIRKTVCRGFSNLYRDLAVAMGLKAEVVFGTNENRAGHAWNTVKIDGVWRVLNVTFGAINFQERKNPGGTSFYFLTQPDIFIYDHFPDDKKWQLLEPAWTREEWESNVRPYGAFFDEGFSRKSLSEVKKKLKVSTEKTITLRGTKKVILQAQLYKSVAGKENLIKGTTLVTRNDTDYNIHIKPPSEGTFTLKIWVYPNWLLWYEVDANSNSVNWRGFPDTLPQLLEIGGLILNPMDGTLPRNKDIDFAIILPGLKKVFIATDTDRVPMTKDNEGIFRARVKTSNKASLLEIQEQPEGEGYFNRIVIYRVE